MSDHKTLVFQRKCVAFFDQSGNFGFTKKKFIKPRNLRKHLQVGIVLRRKTFFCFLGRIPASAKTLPKLVVSRITSNHVDGIRLEQILDGKLALIEREVLRRLGSYP